LYKKAGGTVIKEFDSSPALLIKASNNTFLDTYKEIDTTEYVYALMYNWGKKEYILKEQRD
jgi:hypothetical protein